MPIIRQLSASVVNKIAAGEVIERPASVLKELLENAVDAGAQRVDVAVEQGGGELVRVCDDGCGMSPEQLPLALAPHATSKIQDAEDLFRVATLGFRGEALASIAEVSRMVLRSRESLSDAGAELEVVGGRAGEVVPCGCRSGTTVEVYNLFYNTPVRKKFLRATQTEMGHCSEAFTRIALAHPQTHFTLRHNDRIVYDLPPCESWPERIGKFFGQDLADDLVWVESTDSGVRLRGYVAKPSQSRGNQRMQYVFLNGRAIRDRSLQHALGEAYRGLLLTGRYPICFLQIDMPPDAVDVNVHPTKLEVRFQDSGRLYSQLLGTLRTKFLSIDLTSRLQPAGHENDPAQAHDAARADSLRSELVQWAKGQLASQVQQISQPSLAVSSSSGSLELNYAHPSHAPLELTPLSRNWSPVDGPEEPEPWDAPVTNAEGLSRSERFESTPSPRAAAAMQVHNRYLIAESDEGVVIIDQHALHERILYEQLRAKVLAGQVESQKLLVPEPVDLPPAEAAAVLAQQELLAKLGVQVEPFGGDTVLVTSYPAMLANMNPAEVLHELVDRLMNGGKTPERRDMLDELLHMISCKAAIKAGDRLSHEEVASLIEQRHLAQDTHHCPHGRPTALVFTREELDRQFKRT
jgi:DNA mismatch repair protein MutL